MNKNRILLSALALTLSLTASAGTPLKLMKQLAKVPAAVTTDPITEQPAGRTDNNLRLGLSYFYPTSWGVSNDIEDWLVGNYTVADDGSVYIGNPFFGLNTGTWLKLEKAGGDTLVCRTPQAIFNDGSQTYYAVRMKMVVDDNGTSYVYDTDPADESKVLPMHFLFQNGKLTTLDGNVDDGYPSVMLALMDATGGYYGYGSAVMTLQPVGYTATVLPDGLTTGQEALRYSTQDSTQFTSTIIASAEDGKSLYLRVPELGSDEQPLWIRADKTSEGLKVEKQYLGVANAHHYFCLPGTADTYYDPDWGEYFSTYNIADQVSFDKTGEASYKAKLPQALLVTADDSKVNNQYLRTYVQPELNPFVEVAATPANPSFAQVQPYDSAYASGLMQVVIPNTDVDGKLLNTAKLSYRFYKDDDVYVFSSDEYRYVTGELTELPWSYSDEYDIYSADQVKTIYTFFTDYTKLGVQSIYRGAGEEHLSDIIWYNNPTGISGISARKAQRVEYYDLQGRRVSPSYRGVVIQRFSYPDGSVKVRKTMR